MYYKKPEPSGTNPYSLPEMRYLAASVPLFKMIKEKSPMTVSELSRRIAHVQFIQKTTYSGGDMRASFLLLMSHAIGYNFFRPYINLLPEELRVTDQTQGLLDRIAEQQKEIDKWKERAERAEALIEKALTK